MICKNDEMLAEWNALFNGFEGFSDVERAFKEAFGEALLEANPSLSGLVARGSARQSKTRATTSTTTARPLQLGLARIVAEPVGDCRELHLPLCGRHVHRRQRL